MNVEFNTTGLANDSTYHATIWVLSNDPAQRSMAIPASLSTTTINPAPVHFCFTANTNREYELVPRFEYGDATFEQTPYAVLALELNAVPKAFALAQNYPNPFNPETVIRFEVPQASQVKITIYNVLGQKIATLLDRVAEAGYHEVQWNGRNDAGVIMASGVYLYRMEAGDFTVQKRMVYLR